MTDVPEQLVAAFAGRYELQRLLGRGGMATVYLAQDRKHHRRVAIKVLLPDLAAIIGADRFLREIEIAARLTHPHILPLHDSGDADGYLYYVMPYAEGGSLRGRLTADRALSLDPTLDITAAVADALDYAHAQGVLHRDIKPENILFTAGHPVVTDFGIAKAVVTAGGAQLTRTGFPVGTPGYMSPEQAAGIADVDGRTDVYSLAVVVYEMLTGAIPRGWPTEDDVRAGRLTAAPAAHRATLDALPRGIEAGLARGLAVRLDQRTAAPGALARDLTQRPSHRRYGEAEVQALVRRASELEATAPTVDASMTLGGVERLAAEVGIPVQHVRAAAALTEPGPVAVEPSPFWSRVVGGPTRLYIERLVHGEVADTDFSDLMDEVRATLGEVGIIGTLGRSVTWTAVRTGGRNVQVSVTVREGRTRIRIQDALSDLKAGLFGGVLGGVGGGGMGAVVAFVVETLKAPPILAAAIPLWLLTAFAGTRTIYYYSVRSRGRKLEELADRLAALAGRLARPALPRSS